MKVFTCTSYCYRYARDITIALLLLLPLFSQPAHAEITRTINYQGFLVDSSSMPVDEPIHLRFVFYGSYDGADDKFTETRCNMSVIKGRYEVEIGSETPGGIPDTVFQDNAAIWLEIQIDPDLVCNWGLETEFLRPRIRMQAAPYAFESLHASTASYALHASTASAASLTFRAATIAPLDSAPAGITISTHLFVSGDLRVGDTYATEVSSAGYLTLADIPSAPVAPGRIFFDSSAEQLKISLDGFIFVPIATGTAAGLSTVISNIFEFTGTGVTGSELKLLPSSVTLQGNIFNQVNSLVMLDGTSRLPAVDGSQLLGVIKLTDELQPGATFYVSSGTVKTLTVTDLLEAKDETRLGDWSTGAGLFVNSTGDVFIGTTTATPGFDARLTVKGSDGPGDYLTVIYSGEQIAAWVRKKP